MQQDSSWVPLFPEQASTFAWQVDGLYFYLLAISAFFTIGIVAAIVFFFIKYGEKEKFTNGAEIHGSIALETTWSIIPFIISMTIFLGGAVVYYNQYRVPTDAMEIYVVGKQWMWKIQHGTGQREINDLHVPVGRKIKLTMTTEDVLHDFYIPAFRTKADVIPGRYSTIWFEATKPGKYRIYCAEYCGLNHSGMGGWVYVMEQSDFDNWLSGNVSGQTPVEAGRELFQAKLGCASCHGANGEGGRGPTLQNLIGEQMKMTSGQVMTVDEAYIRESILNPQAQIAAGFQPIMPTFKGQITEEQLNSLIAYIKSLNGTSGTNSGGKPNMMMMDKSDGTMMSEPTPPADKPTKPGSNPNAPKNQPETTNR